MPATCVVGLQWGDEAKGKITDLLSGDFRFAARYNGGANAGHTIVRDGKTFKLSLLPTGVLQPGVVSVIGNGVVVYPPRFHEEIGLLRDAGVSVEGLLKVSASAHVIMPYHLEEERVFESGGAGTIGTTGRGIGPCYQDKAGRRFAIRVGDLLDEAYLRERLDQIVPVKNRVLAAMTGPGGQAKSFTVDQLAQEYLAHGKLLAPYAADTSRLLLDGLDAGESVLFEAAQGSLLDLDHGTFPFVTSSSSLPSGIWSGTGVPSRHLNRVIGVVKAYTSRVGRGPFPTELTDATGERLREIGREYGTVTGRPRRCGWLDAVAVRYTARLAGADEIALMLLDVLSGLPELKIAVGYELDGGRIDHFPADARVLARCTPVYETLPGWEADITASRGLADLPAAARRYVERVAELVKLPVSVVSVGPDRAQTIRAS